MEHLFRLLTPADVSRLSLGAITPAAVRKAADEGRIELAGRTLGGVRLFERDKAEKFLAVYVTANRRRKQAAERAPHRRASSNCAMGEDEAGELGSR